MSEPLTTASEDGEVSAAPSAPLPVSAPEIPHEAPSPATMPPPAETPVITEPPVQVPRPAETPADPRPQEIPTPAQGATPQAPAVSAPAEPEPQPTPAPAPPASTAPAAPSAPPPIPIRERLGQALEAIRFRKRARLEKILQLAQKKGCIKNDDVEKLLRVSDATATRYLSQMVKEGRLRKTGVRGGAYYEPV